MATITPNDEQQAIIDESKTLKDGKVIAGAGVGKTTVLRMIAEALTPTPSFQSKVLYLAFNRSVADEAEASFPEHCLCRNYHRLAWRPFAQQIKRRGGKYPSAKYIAGALGIKPFQAGEHTLTTIQIAVAVKEAIGRFCTSASRTIGPRHIQGVDIVRNTPAELQDKLIAHILPYVTKAWADIANPNGSLPYMPGRGDGCYVKLWSLSDPQLGFSTILYDEAQDANPAVAHVVSIQKNCQRIYVGDSAQAIYGWNGAVDALSKFNAAWTLELAQSYRFGQAIADEANKLLSFIPGTTLRLKGFEKIDSIVGTIEQPTAILCRTNAGCIESALEAQSNGQRVSIAGGTKDIEAFTKAARDLMDGEQVTHPELASFHSWEEVQVAVQSGEATEIGMMVRLLDNYGVDTVLAVCRSSIKPEDADVTVSTAHKAKGLEWGSVKIHSDFKAPKEGGSISAAEAMLIYVAVTRAKKHLDMSALSWLDTMEQELVRAGEGF